MGDLTEIVIFKHKFPVDKSQILIRCIYDNVLPL